MVREILKMIHCETSRSEGCKDIFNGSRLLKWLPFFILMSGLIFYYGDLKVFAAVERYAENESYKTTCAEVDNVDYRIFGNYVEAYRVNALFPSYFPLKEGQEDLCQADFEDCLEMSEASYPFVAYFNATGNNLKFIPKSAGAEWWNPPEFIDSSANVGQYASLTDPPRIAYYDAANKTLKYSVRTPSGWTGAVALDNSPAKSGLYTSMALDSSKYPHIAYYDLTNGKLKYIAKTAAGWPASGEVAASMGDVTKYRYEFSGFKCVSLNLDGSNIPHIVYYDANDGFLKYINKSGGSWSSPVTVDSSSVVGWYISSAIDPSANIIHVAYYDTTNGYLKYVRRTGSVWSSPQSLDTDNKVIYDVNVAVVNPEDEEQDVIMESHTGVNKVGQMVSLALDSGGMPHIAYSDDRSLKYIYYSGGSWQTRTVIGPAARFVALAIDSSNYPHIAYYDKPADVLQYVYKSADSAPGWECPEGPDLELDFVSKKMLPRKHSGYYISLTLSRNKDGSDSPHISYYDNVYHYLKYVYKGPYGWVAPEVFDNVSGGYVGLYSSIKVESKTVGEVTTVYPHISYYDLTSGRLKYVYKPDMTLVGEGWSVPSRPDSQDLGPGGTPDGIPDDVGQYVSMDVDNFGQSIVAYYDATNKHLKHAYKERDLVWNVEDLSAIWGITDDIGRYVNLDVDLFAREHLAFYNATTGKLGYAYFTGGGGWSGVDYTLDMSADNVGKYLSMKVDKFGFPHIAYYNATTKSLMYVYKSSIGWSTPKVLATFTSPYAGEGNFISLDVYWPKTIDKSEAAKHRAPQIAYLDPGAGKLQYIYNKYLDNNTKNESNMIVQAENYTSIVSGWFNKVARKEALDGWVLRGSGPTKTGEVAYVVTFPYAFTDARISLRYSALYKNGKVEVYIDDGLIGQLGFEATGSFELFREAMLRLGDVSAGAHTIKLKVLPGVDNDVLEIDALTIISNDWSAPYTLDSSPNIGQYISLGVDFFGYPHIAYYDGANGDVKYVFKYQYKDKAKNFELERVWSRIETLESSGDVGKFVSLSITGYKAPPPSSPGVIFSNGDVVVNALYEFSWWRPRGMDVKIKGGASVYSNIHYITILKKLPGTKEFPQLLVLYQDGNTRLIPLPPEGRAKENIVCFGTSTIVGPAMPIPDSVVQDRPFAPVRSVEIDPNTLSLNITFETEEQGVAVKFPGGSVRLDLFPERSKLSVNVTDINFDTFKYPTATLRSMYVYSIGDTLPIGGGTAVVGKHDSEFFNVDRFPDKDYNVLYAPFAAASTQEKKMPGNYWKLYRKTYSAHNTSSPDIEVEMLGPDLSKTRVIEAENYSAKSGFTSTSNVARDTAGGGFTFKFTGNGILAYDFNVDDVFINPVINVRYTDASGGGKVEVLLDGAKTSEFVSDNTGQLGVYKKSGQLSLGSSLTSGAHRVELQVTQNSSSLELDYLAIFPKVDLAPFQARTFQEVMESAVWIMADPAKPLQYEIDSGNTERRHGTDDDRSVKVIFNKANALDSDFGGDPVKGESMRNYGWFAAVIPPTDFFNQDYFSFWAYNDGTPLKFRITLEDERGPQKVNIGGTDVTFGIWESAWARMEPHTVTDKADWENLVLDLTRAFAAHDPNYDPQTATEPVGKLDMTRIKTISFVVAPEDFRAKGTFWIDDFTLSKAVETAPLETFEYDYYGWAGGSVSDIEFLDKIEEDSFTYFWYEANPKNGLIRDGTWAAKESSIAAIGFGLTAYCIGAERGWITRQQAKERVRKVLTTLYNAPQGPEAAGKAGYKGFFYRLLNMDDATRAGDNTVNPTSELSSVDTALLMAGVLTCRGYFNSVADGDELAIMDLAKKLYERVDWPWMLNGASTFSMGWTPESGFMASRWQGYNESMILYLLAIGSPTYPIPASSWNAANWKRDQGSYGGYSLYYASTGALFTYQFSHAWIDFCGKSVDGAFWFENSRNAALANRAFCDDNNAYPTYGLNSWGLTSSVSLQSDGACKKTGEGYGVFGAAPPNGTTHDGTIAPYGAAGSIIFTSGSPFNRYWEDEQYVIPALRYFYQFKDDLYGEYGFLDSFRLCQAPVMNGDKVTSYKGVFASQYLGIDQGITVLMIENYRTGFVYQRFMALDAIQNAMDKAGFTPKDATDADVFKWYAPQLVSQGKEAGSFWGPAATWVNGFNLAISQTDNKFYIDEAPDSTTPTYTADGRANVGNHALRIRWTEKNLNFTNFIYDLRHDKLLAPAGRIGNYTDLTKDGKNTISMMVKSDTDKDFQIGVRIYDIEPGRDPVTGEPKPSEPGHGVDLEPAAYIGNGTWQKMTWFYGEIDPSVLQNAKVIYFFPYPNKADGGGTLYIDNLCLDIDRKISIPDLQKILDEIDQIDRNLEYPEADLRTLYQGLVAAGVPQYTSKFVYDYLEGVKDFRQVVKYAKVYINQKATQYPNLTFFGLLWMVRGLFFYQTFMNTEEAWNAEHPLDEQSVKSYAFALGYLGGLNIAFGNLARVMSSQVLDMAIEGRNISYSAFTAIPAEQRMVAFWPWFKGQLESAEGTSVTGKVGGVIKTINTQGGVVPSIDQTRKAYREGLAKIEEAVASNYDPNNNIIYGMISDSKNLPETVIDASGTTVEIVLTEDGIAKQALDIEKEEVRNWIDNTLKVKYPNVKFFWMIRTPTQYEVVMERPWAPDIIKTKRGWELKGGAIVDFLNWLSGAGDFKNPKGETEAYREIAEGKLWRDFIGTHTKEDIFGTAASPVPMENFFSIDFGDTAGPGGVFKMTQALAHPDNKIYPMIVPDCVIGNYDESMFAGIMSRARLELRAVERAVWKVYGTTFSYGKFAGKVETIRHIWNKYPMPEQGITGEDLPMSMMVLREYFMDGPNKVYYKIGYSDAVKVFESSPVNYIAERMTALKWMYQDFTTAPLGGVNIGKWPNLWDDRVKNRTPEGVDSEWVNPIRDFFSKWRIRSNLYARAGDPALFTLLITDLMAKMNPGYISLIDEDEALGLFVASMASLIMLPRIDAIVRYGGAYHSARGLSGKLRYVADAPVITMMMLEGVIDKSWTLWYGWQAYRQNIAPGRSVMLGLPRPSLVEYQFKPYFYKRPPINILSYNISGGDPTLWKRSVIGNTWRSLSVGWGILIGNAVYNEYYLDQGVSLENLFLGGFLSWYDLPFIVSWSGASQVTAWIWARRSWQEVAEDCKAFKYVYNFIHWMKNKGHLAYLKLGQLAGKSGTPLRMPADLNSRTLKEEVEFLAADTGDLHEALWQTYEIADGRNALLYGERGAEITIANVAYSVPPQDETKMVIDILDAYVPSEMSTYISESEANRWLILDTYQRYAEVTKGATTPKPVITKIAARTWLGQSVWDAFNSLVSDGLLQAAYPEGEYWVYLVPPESDLLKAGFIITGTGIPGLYKVIVNEFGKTVMFKEVALIQNSVLKALEMRILEDGKIKIKTGTDTYILDRDILVDKAGGDLSFSAKAGDGISERNFKLTKTEFVIDAGSANELSIPRESASSVNIFQDTRDAKEAAEKMFWNVDLTPSTPNEAEALINKVGGLDKFNRMHLVIQEEGKATVLFSSVDHKLQISNIDWYKARDMLPNNEFVMLYENFLPGMNLEVGRVKLTDRPGAVEMTGDMFNWERPSVPITENLNDWYSVRKQTLALSGIEPDADRPLVRDMRFSRDKAIWVDKAMGVVPTDEAGEQAIKPLTGRSRVDAMQEWKMTPDGQVEVNSISAAPETIPASRFKELSKKVGRVFFSTPARQMGSFTAGGHGVFIILKYRSDEYTNSDQIWGDIAAAAIDAGQWTAAQLVVERVGARLGAQAFLTSFGGSQIWAIPLIIVGSATYNFGNEFVLNWGAETAAQDKIKFEDFSGKLTSYMQKFNNVSYRAWVSAVDDFKREWFYLFSPYGSGIRTFVEGLIADNIQAKWVLESSANAEAQAAWEQLLEPSWTTPEILAALGQKAAPAIARYDQALVTAKLYGAEYQTKIIDILLDDLSWSLSRSGPADVGSSGFNSRYPFDADNPMANPSPVPLEWSMGEFDYSEADVVSAAGKIKDHLVQSTYDLWRLYAEGSEGWFGVGKIDPISVHLGYAPTLDEVIINTVREVQVFRDEILKAHLDGKFSSWFFSELIGEARLRRHVYSTGSISWLDVRTAILTLDELLKQLRTADFLDYGIYTSVTPNMGFETLDKSYVPFDVPYKVYNPGGAVPTNFTLSNFVIFGGVKYYWDVSAHNLYGGDSPLSEQWNFIGVE